MNLANIFRGTERRNSSPVDEGRRAIATNERKQDRINLLFLFLTASLLLLVCSRNSYAFIYQEWGDPIIYMNVGRAIRNGAVLYRDIFDHKGPLLPLVYVVLSMISPFPFSMSGLYVFQCVTLSAGLFYLYRTARLFLASIPSVGICIGFLFFLLNGLTYGQGGGSAEELLLPLYMGTLYEAVRYFGSDRNADAGRSSSTEPFGDAKHRVPAFFRLGLFVGIIALIKINLALFPAVITCFLLATYIVSRDLRGLGKAVLRVIGGGLTAAVPCALYIWATDSFSSFWEGYITFNLTYAAQSGNTTDASTFLSAAADCIFLNLAAALCILAGAGCFVVQRNRFSRLGQIALAVGFLTLFASVFAAHRAYPYLFIPLISYVGLSEIAIVLTVQRILFRVCNGKSKATTAASWKLILAGGMAVLVIAASNGAWSETRWFQTEKTGTQRIAEQIQTSWRVNNKDTSPSILLFNSGDIGFYQLTESVPNLRFFHAPMIDYSVFPGVIDAQVGYIRDGLPDYVIFLWHEKDFFYDFTGVNPAYVVAGRDEQEVGGTICYITLYEKQAAG